MTGALEGVVVADLSEGIAGGYSTKLLAGMGAEVIKVEPPGRGDALRSTPPFKDDTPDVETSALHLHLSMGKKSITLDFESESGSELLRRLLRQCDVFVEGCAPGVLERWRLDHASLAAEQPALIVVSVTPFGKDGPYSGYKGGELIEYSAGGYTYLTGLPDKEPIKAGGSQAEYQGGLHAAAGIMAALLMRDLTGEGDHIDVSVAEAICYAHAGMSAFLNSGQVYTRVGARLLSDLPAAPYPSTILPCKDGFVHAHWAPTDPSLLGVLTDTPRLSEPEVWETPRGHADEIDALLGAWLAKHGKYEAVRKAQELRHPFTEVLNPSDLLDDPQFVARGFFVELEHPRAGRFRHLGAPLTMTGTPWRSATAPLLGQHNAEIYCGRLGLARAELGLLRDRGVI